MIQKLTLIYENKSQITYLRTTVAGYFVTKYILKAGYPTSGSKFDIFFS